MSIIILYVCKITDFILNDQIFGMFFCLERKLIAKNIQIERKIAKKLTYCKIFQQKRLRINNKFVPLHHHWHFLLKKQDSQDT